MATDATGTPTTLGIPKYNTPVDAPSGRGNGAQMDAIDALLQLRPAKPAGMAAGEAMVWDGAGWVRSSVTRLGASSLGSGTPDATKVLRGDGAWVIPIGAEMAYVEKVTSTTGVVATTEATATTIITLPSFTADGVSKYRLEYFSPYVTNTALAASCFTTVYDNAVDMFVMGQTTAFATGQGASAALSREWIPAAGAHVYSIRGYVTSGSGTWFGDAGGVGQFGPMYARVTKAT